MPMSCRRSIEPPGRAPKERLLPASAVGRLAPPRPDLTGYLGTLNKGRTLPAPDPSACSYWAGPLPSPPSHLTIFRRRPAIFSGEVPSMKPEGTALGSAFSGVASLLSSLITMFLPNTSGDVPYLPVWRARAPLPRGPFGLLVLIYILTRFMP